MGYTWKINFLQLARLTVLIFPFVATSSESSWDTDGRHKVEASGTFQTVNFWLTVGFSQYHMWDPGLHSGPGKKNKNFR